MKTAATALDDIRIASPCTVSWEGMTGDDRVRHCGQCRLNVYNLSEMTRTEAEALVGGREGRLCVRFYTRADGTMLTRDCPVGLAAVRRRIARAWAAAAAMVVGLFTAGCGRAVVGGDPATPPGPIHPTMGKPAMPPVMGDVADPRRLQGEVYIPPKEPATPEPGPR